MERILTTPKYSVVAEAYGAKKQKTEYYVNEIVRALEKDYIKEPIAIDITGTGRAIADILESKGIEITPYTVAMLL